jgi:hypothetical protein
VIPVLPRARLRRVLRRVSSAPHRCLWGFHEREAFRLLRLVVPDDLNRIRYEIFGGEPLFNVIGRDPDRQIA